MSFSSSGLAIISVSTLIHIVFYHLGEMEIWGRGKGVLMNAVADKLHHNGFFLAKASGSNMVISLQYVMLGGEFFCQPSLNAFRNSLRVFHQVA